MFRDYVVMRFACNSYGEMDWLTVVCDRNGTVVAYWTPDLILCENKKLAVQIDMLAPD